MSGPEVVTLGCRLNLAESDAIRALATGEKDLIVVNSCAVTGDAVRRTRQAIRRARKARPGAWLVVTGCAAQIDPDSFAAMPEVDSVVGNGEKFDPASFQRKLESPFSLRPEDKEIPAFAGMTDQPFVSDIMAVRDHAPRLVSSVSDRTRAFVAVQTGCDHRCTFCIIPFGRGNSRSMPAGMVVDGVERLVDDGAREVVLTGVDVTSYGADLPGAPTLGMLVERILRHVPALPRLRLSSLDSVEMDERLFDIVTGEPRLMPHLHMSFQSGDDMILKRMKRRHSRAQAIDMVARIKAKRPEVAIGADLIAGFPTESEEMAENSLALIDECDIVMGHIFPYSPRRGTPAARMPQVPHATISGRAARLRAATARRKAIWLEGLVGTIQRVLIERSGTRGHAENFAPISLKPSPLMGEGSMGVALEKKTRGLSGDITPAQPLPIEGRGVLAGAIVAVKVAAIENGILVGTPA